MNCIAEVSGKTKSVFMDALREVMRLGRYCVTGLTVREGGCIGLWQLDRVLEVVSERIGGSQGDCGA